MSEGINREGTLILSVVSQGVFRSTVLHKGQRQIYRLLSIIKNASETIACNNYTFIIMIFVMILGNFLFLLYPSFCFIENVKEFSELMG